MVYVAWDNPSEYERLVTTPDLSDLALLVIEVSYLVIEAISDLFLSKSFAFEVIFLFNRSLFFINLLQGSHLS